MKDIYMIVFISILFCACIIDDVKDDIDKKVSEITGEKPIITSVELLKYDYDSEEYLKQQDFTEKDFLYAYFTVTDSDNNADAAMIEILKDGLLYAGPIIVIFPTDITENNKNFWYRKEISLKNYQAGQYEFTIFVSDKDGNNSRKTTLVFNVVDDPENN